MSRTTHCYELHVFHFDELLLSNLTIVAEQSEQIGKSVEGFFTILLAHLESVEEEEKKFLEASSSDPNAPDNSGDSLLICRIRSGDIDGVQIELGRGANPEQFSSEGRSALGEAIAFGETPIVKLLLSSGADANARNTNGETPIMIAAHYSKKDCIEHLLNAGATLTAKDNDGKTAYDHVCVIHGTPEIKKLLQ